MREKLYLVDGMSHVYRAYYAVQGLTNKQGLPTNAVYGFTNMLRKLIAEEKPQYLGVAIDPPGPTVRHEKFEGYKATRRPMPEDLKQQMPYVLKVCQALRVPVVVQDRYEADDVIGTLARLAEEQDLDIVIVTIDKDMFQLVDDRVSILDTRTMTRLDSKGVEKKFGVPPDRVADVLSLVGDTSDNIPGAPGIGEKGARTLISQFGGLEQLLRRRDEVSRKTYRESLQENEQQIRQSRELVEIHRDLPLQLDLADLKLSSPDSDFARRLFTELEFISLLEEFLPAGGGDVETCYETIETPRGLKELQERVRGQPIALAPVYDDASPSSARLSALGLAVAPGLAWSISPRLLQAKPEHLSPLLEAAAEWAVHDLKPLYAASGDDLRFPGRLSDTKLMGYLLAPNHNDFSLQKLALEYLQYRVDEAAQPQGSLFDDATAADQAERADLTFRLQQQLSPRIEALGMRGLLEEIEIPLVKVLADMERTGVRVDCDLLSAMSSEMEGEIQTLTDGIYEIAGLEFNINSPKQLADVLFEKLQLPVARKTRKAGHYATGVEVLESLAADHEIARMILDYRELTKLKNTYLDALPKLIHPETERIHTSYNQMVAATGRLSSSNPNLQNIPIKSALGRKIRRAFVAEPGFAMLAADYSQIELRVMAHLSQDPVLVEAFGRGEDIHERTAREVFGVNAAMNPQEFRRHAKVINFGIIYGLSAFGLAQSLKIDRKEAQRFIDSYFERYRGVKAWIDAAVLEVREKGYVTTLFGRIRQIPEIRSRNWNLRSFGERTAINAPIQGTAADLIKKAMVSIHGRLARERLKSRLILQVHDELVFEAADSELDLMKRLVKEEMEGVAPLSVPLKVDMAIGPSWFEAK